MALQFRLNRVAVRLLVSYGVILVLPCFFILLMYYQSLSLATRTCIDESLISLRQMRTDMDERLDLMDKAAMLLAGDIGVRRMMYYDKPEPGCPFIYQIRQFSDKLYYDKLGVLSEPLSTYRLLFKDNELVFYDNTLSIGLEFYFNNFMKYGGMNFEEWYGRIFSLTRRTILPAAGIDTGVDTIRAITYVFPLSKAAGRENGGLLLFLIPAGIVDDSMNPAKLNGAGTVSITDGGGAVIYQAGFSPSAAPPPPPPPARRCRRGLLPGGNGYGDLYEVAPKRPLLQCFPALFGDHGPGDRH